MDNFIPTREEEISLKNSELDLKTQILFKEVEDVMLRSNEPIVDELNTTLVLTDTHQGDQRSSYSASFTYEDENLNLRRKLHTVIEPELKFLRAKIKILTTEMDRQKKEYQRKIGEYQTRETELVLTQKEYEKISQQNTALNHQLVKLTAAFTECKDKLQHSETENTKISHELNIMKRECKKNSQKSNTLEIRLNRLSEENENLKAALRNTQLKFRENNDEHRQILEQQISCVQRNEKQKNELALAFRRQMLLIQNLQKQKEILVAGAALKEAETIFDQLLTIKKRL